MQIDRHTIKHGIPAPVGLLPIQRDRVIPRTVIAAEQPAPVGRVGQQDPGRFAHGASQMRHAGIHTDHQIHQIAQRGGIGKLDQFITDMANG